MTRVRTAVGAMPGEGSVFAAEPSAAADSGPNDAGNNATGSTRGECPSPEEIVGRFRAQIGEGVPWHRAMLEAMGRWTLTEERHRDRHYKYIIGRESFDWLLLAERLCLEANDLIPLGEVERLLFEGTLPEDMDDSEIRDLLGVSKYRGYLNFHYGVVLEEALQLAAEEYVRKRHLAKGFSDSEELVEDAFRHLYVSSRDELLAEYRANVRLGKRNGLTLSDLKEFTYWLHKRRVNYWDPARVAYDTRLAILRLQALQESAKTLTLLQ